jgi:hypothetical protein
MRPECNPKKLSFAPVGRRRVEAAFDGGRVTSDAGVLLLREVASKYRLFSRVAKCFRDHRDRSRIEHSVEQMVAQRVLGIACGYEDLEDHDLLRRDPVFALAAGARDLLGARRVHASDRGSALAGKSTLQRLEATPGDASAKARYSKIVYDQAAMECVFVDLFLDAFQAPPESIVLDVDSTDDPVHGMQEGRFFHGYYDQYIYLPLYIFCDGFLLVSKLRTADVDGASGTKEELERVVRHIRSRWPSVKITVRADSGFCRDEILSFCEQNQVDYVIGLSGNQRLLQTIEDDLATARAEHERTGKPCRVFRDLVYRTRDSWSAERRVVAKAERIDGKDNPRFVVTSLKTTQIDARTLYERLYCARGDMENRIKEQQLGLFADRTSSHTMRANQLRLWFSSFAYVLLHLLRHTALATTTLAKAQVGTLREKLLKLGARVVVSARRVVLSLSSSHPMQEVISAAVRFFQPRLGA